MPDVVCMRATSIVIMQVPTSNSEERFRIHEEGYQVCGFGVTVYAFGMLLFTGLHLHPNHLLRQHALREQTGHGCYLRGRLHNDACRKSLCIHREVSLKVQPYT